MPSKNLEEALADLKSQDLTDFPAPQKSMIVGPLLCVDAIFGKLPPKKRLPIHDFEFII